MSRKLILIVGLQKSGTTLLSRLLQHSGLVENPFNKEGHDFWGNIPIFSPQAYPAGTIYQKYRGEKGHEIGLEDMDPEMVDILHKKLENILHCAPLIVNKNPFNTVRIPWIRKIFPEAYIIGMTRNPISNVFSLLKKFVSHVPHGSPPEHGWWGVKPAHWQNFVFDDKVTQLAYQWQTVNAKLGEDQNLLNQLIYYHDLCEDPQKIVENIIQDILGENFYCTNKFPALYCLDNEYKTGASFVSKNRYFAKTGSFFVKKDITPEIQPLTKMQIKIINSICNKNY